MCLARIVTSGMHVACIVSKFSSDISKTTVSKASGKVVLKLTSLLKFSMCVCDSVNFLFCLVLTNVFLSVRFQVDQFQQIEM